MNIRQPIVIVGAPRSGTTLLYSILSSHPELWSLYGESEWLLKKHFHPEKSGWKRGNHLEASDVTTDLCATLRRQFYKYSHNYQAIFRNSYSTIYTNFWRERLIRSLNLLLVTPLLKPSTIRLVEKNPKTTLRVEFMNALFPDAYFVHLIRDPRANINSLMVGWCENGRYETYDVPGGVDLVGYEGRNWNFLLPKGWEQYSHGVSLEEVCAFQYRSSNLKALQSLEEIPSKRKLRLRYEDLVDDPKRIIRELCVHVGIGYLGGLKRFTEEMPVVNASAEPSKDKWQQHRKEISSVLDQVRDVAQHLGYTV